LINAMLDPQTAKAVLEELRAATAKREQARAAAIEEQKKAASDRAAVDAAMAQLADARAALDARDHSISNREQVFEQARSELRRKGVPIVGTAIGALTMPAVGAGATWIIGKVFIKHFTSGGTLQPSRSKRRRRAIVCGVFSAGGGGRQTIA
jgi:hypothetical protein